MNAKLIAVSVMAGAIAMPSFANDVNASGEVGYFASVPSGPSMYTRAQVVEELMAALAALAAAPVEPPPSTITRDQVVAELMTALREGTVPPTAEHADIGATGTAMAGATPTPEPAQSTLAAR